MIWGGGGGSLKFCNTSGGSEKFYSYSRGITKNLQNFKNFQGPPPGKKWHFPNPITYGILTFGQLPCGLFGPDPENKVRVNRLIWNLALIMVWIILVNMQNFKLIAFLLLEIWCHKNFLSIMERVIAIRYLRPGVKQNSTKITFYAWKHIFWHKVIPPSALPLFSSKNKRPPHDENSAILG